MNKIISLLDQFHFLKNFRKWKFKKNNEKILNNKSIGKEPKNKFPLSGIINYEFNYNPKISVIINYFTSLGTLKKTIDNLRFLGDQAEIIVINDRSQDFDEINSKLSHSNDRMIVTKDLGELRGYTYGAKLSNASDFLIFTQDDDLCPPNKNWLDDCIKEFEIDTKLGMIGLCGGGIHHAQKKEIDFAYQKDLKDPKFKNHSKFYCSWLKTGPLMIRKNLFEKMGGWSEYGFIGECAHFTDPDLAMRCWLNDAKSMLLLTSSTLEWKRRFDRGDGFTKSDLKSHNNRNLGIIARKEKFLKKFEKDFEIIESRVKSENLKIGIKY
ncbi:glycosyltransferase [Candidatus Pelagibacter sp.]|uniref:glycosyltransferase n=1 Tax=Candidatus Pelagibacter sp. TaxID=2024849 RepID=UPI003F864F94